MPSVTTPIGMLSFPHLFKPKPRAANKEADFSASLIFSELVQKTPEYAALKKAVLAAVEEEWPGKSKDEAFLKRLTLPFRDAGEKDYQGYTPGSVFVSAWTKKRPGVINGRKEDIDAPDDVWAGQLARFTVTPFAWDFSGKRGVSLALNNVQITKSNMPRIDGRKPAREEFDAVEEEGSDESESAFA